MKELDVTSSASMKFDLSLQRLKISVEILYVLSEVNIIGSRVSPRISSRCSLVLDFYSINPRASLIVVHIGSICNSCYESS